MEHDAQRWEARPVSRAAKQLTEILAPKKEQLTQARLAIKLGVSRQAVHAWLTGISRPDLDHAFKLHALTGIPVDDWCRE